MRVFNIDKTQELTEYDLTKGYLKSDKIIIHHEAVEAIPDVGHYVVIAEYPNGGKDVEWVVEKEGVEGHEAYDEEELIDVYIPYSENERLKISYNREIDECTQWLLDHDYIGIKIATGRATIDEYADEIAEMKIKADRINELNRLLLDLK